MNDIVNLDLNKVCRTCLGSAGMMGSIYDNASLIYMIKSCAKVQVYHIFDKVFPSIYKVFLPIKITPFVDTKR